MTSSNSSDIPQLSDDDIKFVYAVNDSYLNELVIHALTHGMLPRSCILRKFSDAQKQEYTPA